MPTRTTSKREARPTYQGRLVREYRRKHALTYEDVCNQMYEAVGHKPSPASLLNLEKGYVETPRSPLQRAVGAILGRDHLELWPEA